MYSVFLYNLGYYLQEDYPTYEMADTAGRACGFQYVIEAV